MAKHVATVVWERGDAPFTDMRFSRAHQWQFDGGVEVPASASPHVVRVPMSVEEAVDPEEAFIASLASCHMLFFLAFAAKRGFVVDRYEDQAEGALGRGEDGRTSMTQVILHPDVQYQGSPPGSDEEQRLHHDAHEACYIANSVRTEVQVEPVAQVDQQ